MPLDLGFIHIIFCLCGKVKQCVWAGGELHMKELYVHYSNMLAELQFLHYVNSIQYYNYRNAIHFSG
jgi:hypothetical protein